MSDWHGIAQSLRSAQSIGHPWSRAAQPAFGIKVFLLAEIFRYTDLAAYGVAAILTALKVGGPQWIKTLSRHFSSLNLCSGLPLVSSMSLTRLSIMLEFCLRRSKISHGH
jgi:hypothetical protein